MYLKLLNLLIIPFFSNFVYCFKTAIIWEEYSNEIRSNAETVNEFNAILCKEMETNSSMKYLVCQRVFRLLRDDTTENNPYRHSLYMNYDAFNLSLIDPEFPVCQEKRIISAGKFMSLNCYGSPPIRSANSQNDKYLKEISVLYGVHKELTVLKCHESNVICDFLERYDYNEWRQFSDIPVDVFNIPIPQYATIDKLKSAFHGDKDSITKKFSELTESHFLHKRNRNAEKLSELCDLILENHEFKNKNKYKKLKQNFRTSTTLITSLEQTPTETENSHNEPKDIQKVEVLLKTFNCSKYKYRISQNMKVGFHILPGLDENSVLHIEPLIYENAKYFVPAALIENIHWVYVLNRELILAQKRNRGKDKKNISRLVIKFSENFYMFEC